MGRIFFWVFIGIALYLAIRWWMIKQRLRDRPSAREVRTETMVSCERCGLRLPQSDALVGPADSGRWYCCEEHRSSRAE